MLAGRVPVATTGACGASSAARIFPTIASSVAAVPSTAPLCRQSAVLEPSSLRGVVCSSTWGSWAVFSTSARRETCGPGKITPPTRLPSASTASIVAAVSIWMTSSGGVCRRKAPTVAQSSSAPSCAGLSIRMRTPLRSPGPTSSTGAWVILRSASRIRPVMLGTTLPSITPSMSSGEAPYKSSMLIIL